ncbi:M15 family metallopeptidase [Streptomyces subrutilus]|uniref:D-alanyl-D-alanine dipeptidase n=1 Tax=Streptomyces subrutilus TaxID=36818 RepID=A0A5P2UT93_9ACTN|nr:M15 family metallopeptidase [Streptomyces subrutilus]QEU81559.1 D-alanyl-D-alanine dipeptidase [Streptomyces subrutilus]WSJ29098.1 M15 family metallopeptidase [Streptomyces subrutilus]
MTAVVVGAVLLLGAAAPAGSAGGPGDGAGAPRARAAGADGPRAAPPGFVLLREVDPTIRQDVRYATARNFTGAPVDGYDEPVCLLARPVALALRRAQRELLRAGRSLEVRDCYRPQRAVDRFVRWAGDLGDQATKAEYYPEVDKGRLVPDGYIAARSGHARGSTLDVTLVEWPSGREVDMGTPFDFFSPLSHTGSPAVSAAARAGRRSLVRVLGAQGFVNLPEEWWHFTREPEVFPGAAFDFPVAVAAVRP